MWPHTCSRVKVPAAKRLKYSELRKGFRASSSAFRDSNHSSVVTLMILEGAGPFGPAPRDIEWWRVRDSNPRPRRCERRALPTELTPREANVRILPHRCAGGVSLLAWAALRIGPRRSMGS